MSKDIIRSKDGMVELCMSDVKKSGRVKIKMSALKICKEGEWNKNGITWIEEYCDNNKESAVGMDYVVSFLDGKDGCPTGHGCMTFDEDGNVVFENSVSVGHVEEVSFEDVEIDGKIMRLFMTQGYINEQRYPEFVKWLKDEIQNGRVCGSIEINGKAGADKIVYKDGKSKNDDGTPYFGRIPVEFDFSGLAILCKEIEEPADDYSIAFELNSKNKMKGEDKENMSKVISKSNTVEINKVTVYELYNKVIEEVNKMLNKNYQYDTWVYELYVDTCEVIIKDDSVKDTFYATTYSFVDGKLTIGDIVEVENTWIPKSKSTPVELNGSELNKKVEGEEKMTIEELNTKIEVLEKQVAELNSTIASKDSKIVEVNEALVNSQKEVSELNSKLTDIENELNACKTKNAEYEAKEKEAQEKAEQEAKECEKNNYIKEVTPILNEAELNSVSSLETIDEMRLKVSEICVAKVQAQVEAKKQTETNSKEKETEVNSVNNNMYEIKEPEKKVISDESLVF